MVVVYFGSSLGINEDTVHSIQPRPQQQLVLLPTEFAPFENVKGISYFSGRGDHVKWSFEEAHLMAKNKRSKHQLHVGHRFKLPPFECGM